MNYGIKDIFEHEKESKGFITANHANADGIGISSACSAIRRFVTVVVTGCVGKCYGLGFRKYLIIKECDGLTAQNPGGVGTTSNSRHAFRIFRVVRGHPLLLDKVEKNRISPKTWYWAILQIGKFETAAHQNDPAEIEPNRSLKSLQFLENFSRGDIYRGGGKG